MVGVDEVGRAEEAALGEVAPAVAEQFGEGELALGGHDGAEGFVVDLDFIFAG